MSASEHIRNALQTVDSLRTQAQATPELAQALTAVKTLQARRFAATYADLFDDPVQGDSARFFLDELYGAHDFSDRDSQFARVAPALTHSLPQALLGTVERLVQLHARTEILDFAMAQRWLARPALTPAARYVQAWRDLCCTPERDWQLETVLLIGQTLAGLTRKPALGLLLKAMRRPAQAAGLGQLQAFLERGYTTFARMSRRKGCVDQFLATVATREQAWLDRLNHTPDAADALAESLA